MDQITCSYPSALVIDFSSEPLDLRTNTRSVDLPYSDNTQSIDLTYSDNTQSVDLPYSANTQLVDLPYSANTQSINHPYSANTQSINHPYSANTQSINHPYSANTQSADHTSARTHPFDPMSTADAHTNFASVVDALETSFILDPLGASIDDSFHNIKLAPGWNVKPSSISVAAGYSDDVFYDDNEQVPHINHINPFPEEQEPHNIMIDDIERETIQTIENESDSDSSGISLSEDEGSYIIQSDVEQAIDTRLGSEIRTTVKGMVFPNDSITSVCSLPRRELQTTTVNTDGARASVSNNSNSDLNCTYDVIEVRRNSTLKSIMEPMRLTEKRKFEEEYIDIEDTFESDEASLSMPLKMELKSVMEPMRLTEKRKFEEEYIDIEDTFESETTLPMPLETENPLSHRNECYNLNTSFIPDENAKPKSIMEPMRSREKKAFEEQYIDIEDSDESTLPYPLEMEPDKALLNKGDPEPCSQLTKESIQSTTRFSENVLSHRDSCYNTDMNNTFFPNENKNENVMPGVQTTNTDSPNSTLYNSAWSLGESIDALLSRGNPLRLNFRRTSTGITLLAQNQNNYLPPTNQPIMLEQSPEVSKVSLDSIQIRRIVVGSNESYNEESTIANEGSQIQPDGSNSTVATYPATPDITIAGRTHTHTPTTHAFPVSHVGGASTPISRHRLSSTLRDLNHIRSRSNQDQCRDERVRRYRASSRTRESPRTRLLKQRVVERLENTSVLDTGFQDRLPLDSAGENQSPEKRIKSLKKDRIRKKKKSSFLNIFSRLSKCMTNANNTTLFQSNETALTMKDNSDVTQSCPTTVFQTFTDSSSDDSMPSWCQHIREVTKFPGPARKEDQSVGRGLRNSFVNAGTNTTSRIIGLGETDCYISDLVATKLKSSRVEEDCSDNTRTRTITTSGNNHNHHHHQQQHQQHQQQHKPCQPHSKSLPDLHQYRISKTDSTKHCPPTSLSQGNSSPDSFSPNEGDKTFRKPRIPTKCRPSSKSVPHLHHHINHNQETSKTRQGSGRHSADDNRQRIRSTRHTMSLSPLLEAKDSDELNTSSESDVRINLLNEVGRQTAQWLATFVGDNDAQSHSMPCDVQPNKNVLLQLCTMCKIKVKWPYADSSMITLTKTRKSRAPTEADLKCLVRGTRRRGSSNQGSTAV